MAAIKHGGANRLTPGVALTHPNIQSIAMIEGHRTDVHLSRRLKTWLAYIAPLCNQDTMKLEKELVAASSVPLVLSILSEGDSYGYAIIQRVKELSGGNIEWTDGMLYPVLHWLEDQRLVRSRWTTAESGRRRKYYSLRAEGRRALTEQKRQWNVVTSTLNQLWRPQDA